MRTPLYCLGLLLALTTASPAQVTVDRGIPAGFGGLSSNYTVGGSVNQFSLEAQPFVTPDATNVRLDEFSFHYIPNPGFPSNTLQVAIVEWYPSDAVEGDAHSIGSPLWNSSIPSTSVTIINTPSPTNPFGGTEWHKYTFTTGGLVLDSAKTYAWILMQSATADPGNNQSGAFAFSAAVPTFQFEGKAFSSTTPWTYTDLANASWGGTANYLAYSATFAAAAIPEPAHFAGLAGLAGLAFVQLKRRRRA